MQTNLYTIYDEITETYFQPFHAKHEREAIRNLSYSIKDENSRLHQNHQDFSLYYVGTYDDSTGLFTSTPQPVLCLKITALYNSLFPAIIQQLEAN